MNHDEDFPIERLSDPSIMYLCSNNRFEFKNQYEIGNELRLFCVDEISFEDKAPRRAALENVLSAIHINGVNFIFLILGEKNGARFYYGVSRDDTYKLEPDLSIEDIGSELLLPSIRGNFRGSNVKRVSNNEISKIIGKIHGMKQVGMIEGVPGTNKDDEKFQGIDRLVDVMHGEEFAFMVIARPLDLQTTLDIQSDIYSLYSKIAPLSKRNTQTSSGYSKGTNRSTSRGSSVTTGSGESHSDAGGTSESESETESDSKSKTTTDGTGTSSSKSKSNSGGKTESSGTSTSHSDALGESSSTGSSKSNGKSRTITESTSSSRSETKNEGSSDGESETTSNSEAVGVEYINKEIQDWIKYLDEVIFPRLDYGKGKGIYASVIAAFANDKLSLHKLQNTAVSLCAGETGNRVPLRAVTDLPQGCRQALKNFRLPFGKIRGGVNGNDHLAHIAMSQITDKDGNSYIGNWITTNELGLIAGLPQKEIMGLSLNAEVEFGLNVRQKISEENSIKLGSLVQSGNVLNENPVYLDKNVLDQHIFIAGVTGSGKTTTCQKILQESGVHFLVIEPAKTEYRILKDKCNDLLVFTLGKNDIAPFKLNPFCFFPHESITSHVDMIKASIESAFDMEAAIPQIIEAALYRSYEQYGWNIAANKNFMFSDPFEPGANAFPTLDDLLKNAEEITREQGFDDRLRDEYIGSIRARLQGLLVGSKGFMLNTHTSMDFEELLEHNVVLELEEIRSGTEKALVMGFILTNLAEAIKAKYKKSGKFKHITLVEEAHRLLGKYQPGDHPNKRHAVEMFADMLAEIRKYGESLMIVDQIPNKLTPEVLKNTNTKIIHRLFAADDKDAIGNTMMLTKEQKEFLSDLDAGRAVYFTSGIDKAVQIQIDKSSDTAQKTPDDSVLISAAWDYYRRHYKKGLIRGLELFDKEPDLEQTECIIKLGDDGNAERLFANISKAKNTEPLILGSERAVLLRFADIIGLDILARYIGKYLIGDYAIRDMDDEKLSGVIRDLLYKNTFSAVERKRFKDLFNRV